MMNPPVPRWTVTAQQETRQQAPNGVFLPGVLVSYRTEAGIVGSVFLPDRDYTVENVRRAIAERVTLHNAVGELTG